MAVRVLLVMEIEAIGENNAKNGARDALTGVHALEH